MCVCVCHATQAEAPSEVPNGQHTTDANGTSGALNGKADSYAAAVKRDTGVAAETKPDSTQVGAHTR